MSAATTTRLDSLVTARGLAPSRARARDAILRGHVSVDGLRVTKPGASVAQGAAILLDDPAATYVSRAALKLAAGLDHFRVSPDGRDALDLGASTGGFTELVLRRGARSVVAVDVGHDQLHASLRDDPRIKAIEGLNARVLTREAIGGARFSLLVCDVSFISLKLALPPALSLAEPGSDALLLVKPQFEVGREAIGKNGIVRDDDLGPRTADDMAGWLSGIDGWQATGWIASPIAGGEGNREFILHGRKS